MKNFISTLLSLFLLVGVFNDSIAQNGHVSLNTNNKRFQLNGQDWYPMVLNYNVDIRLKNSGYIVTPRDVYNPNYGPSNESPWSDNPLTGANYANDALIAHLKYIKDEMHFNTIRLTGLAVEPFNNDNSILSDYFNKPSDGGIIAKYGSYANFFAHIETVVDIAECVGLKVILLASTKIDYDNFSPEAANYFYQLADYFKDNTTIIAYDFYNEPLYNQQQPIKTKSEIYDIVKCLNNAVKTGSSNHLTTIGIHAHKNAKDWDPNLLDVDFLSFHMYPYHAEYPAPQAHGTSGIDNDLKWIVENVNEPWIIGETAIDSENGTTIKNFNSAMMNKVKAAGASGYSYWHFQNFGNPAPGADYDKELHYGLRTVSTSTQQVNSVPSSCGATSSSLQIYGNDKHIGIYSDIQNFMNSPYTNSPPIAPTVNSSDYYYTGNGNTPVIGHVLDMSSNPIPNAIVEFDGGQTTFTKADGSFALQLNSLTITVSAYGYSRKVAAVVPLPTISSPVYLPKIGDASFSTYTVSANETFDRWSLTDIDISNFTVQPNNQSTSFTAGNSITLHSGFSAETGSVFTAQIFGLNCAPLNQRMAGSSVVITDAIYSEEETESPLKAEKPQLEGNTTFSIYPNPNNGEFVVALNNFKENSSVIIYDLMGKVVFSKNAEENLQKVDLTSHPKGIYLVKVKVGDKIFNDKIVYQ